MNPPVRGRRPWRGRRWAPSTRRPWGVARRCGLYHRPGPIALRRVHAPPRRASRFRDRLRDVPVLDLPLDAPLDLAASMGPLARGRGDRTIRIAADRAWWATRTPDGPGTLGLRVRGGRLRAEAWGPGGDRLIERVPRLFSQATGSLSGDDDPRISALA